MESSDYSSEVSKSRPTTETQHICIQLIAILIFAGIFFQLKHLNDNSLDFEIYNAVLFLIGILIMIISCIKIINYSIPELQNELCIYLRIQKHHYFIIVLSGILTSGHIIFHLCYLFLDYNILTSTNCKNNEVICGITQIIFLLGIYMQIFYFYKLDGANIPANATFNGVFIFLFLINLIGYMTTFIFEFSLDVSNCNVDGYHINIQDTKNKDGYHINIQDTKNKDGYRTNSPDTANNKDNCTKTMLTIEGIFLNSSTQYFLVSAYVMLSLYWQLNQDPSIENIRNRYSLGDMTKSIKGWCMCHRRKPMTSILTEDIDQSRIRTKVTDIFPLLRIFPSSCVVILGWIMGSTIFVFQIVINIFLAKTAISNSTINNEMTYSLNKSNIITSNLTDMYQTNWHYIYIVTNMLDEIAITISVVLAYKTFSSMKRSDFVESSKRLETSGDRFFIIISHCGKIFQNLSGLLEIGRHYSKNYKNLLIVVYGFDDVLGILHAAFQTHFILFTLDWKLKPKDEIPNNKYEKRQSMVTKLCTRAMICGILNMFTSGVYLYEIEQSYFNIQISNQDEYRIVNLFTKPLQVFYSCFSFIYMFKLAVFFSKTEQNDNSSDDFQDNISE